MATVRKKKRKRRSDKIFKPSSSKFAKLLEDRNMLQTDLQKKLEDKSVFRDKMTIQRWCSGQTMCRDLFVIKVLAEILNVTPVYLVKTVFKR